MIPLSTLPIDGAAFDTARDAYAELGWLKLTPGKPATGPGGAPAPRADLTASGVVALEWPAGLGVPGAAASHQHAPALPPTLAGLAGVLRGAPVIELRRNPQDVVLVALLAAPSEWHGQSRRNAGGEIRRLALDVAYQGLERWRRADDQVGVTLPCAGAGASWAQLFAGAPPPCPAELLELLAPSGHGATVELDDAVGDWLVEHFELSDPGLLEGLITRVSGQRRTAASLSREDLHGALLASAGWSAADFSAERLGRLVTDVFGEEVRYRSNAGWRWQLRRRNPTADLPAPAGVVTAKLDPLLVQLAREIHAAREMHPQVKRDRAAAAAEAKRRAEGAAQLVRIWGSQDVLDQLKAEGYLEYHREAEGRRFKGGAQYGEKFVALNFNGATSEFHNRVELPAEAWQLSPPGTPPAERYRRLVEVYIEGGAK